jgi:hypothetical protein
MLTGKITEVSSEWDDNGVAAALVDVPHGYYYFAVKPKANRNIDQMFRTTILPTGVLNGKPYILQSLYYVNPNVKIVFMKEEIDEKNYLKIKAPAILKSTRAAESFNPDKIVYSLYLLNLGSQKEEYKY